jgi:hypothetical protein
MVHEKNPARRPTVLKFDPRLGRLARTQRRQKCRPDGRPLTLTDMAQTVGGAEAMWSQFEAHGKLPHRFESLRDYLTFLGIDIAEILRQFESVRHAYAHALKELGQVDVEAGASPTPEHIADVRKRA